MIVLPVNSPPVMMMRNIGIERIAAIDKNVTPSSANSQIQCEFCCEAKKSGYQGDCSVRVPGCDCSNQ